MAQAMTTAAPPRTVRVAIYCRKSVTEGLDQEFSSLDAQRQAAEAYIESQAGAYDDIVELINDHTGVKIELTAAESSKVAALESSIAQFQSILGPDLSQQPTAQAVANAYATLKL